MWATAFLWRARPGHRARPVKPGLERAYDRHLRGVPGTRQLWLDRHGEVVRQRTLRQPRVGVDLVLHLDAGLQQELERLLDTALAHARATAEAPLPDNAGGCVVVLDVRSGAILAAASAPRFDLARAAVRDPQLWDAVRTDPALPLLDRVTRAALPPGSAFKPVSAVAAVESGTIDPATPFDCIGYLQTPQRHRDYIYRHFGVGHGPTTLPAALAQSCNVYFFHAARGMGAEPLLAWATRFGFGQPTGIGPARRSGRPRACRQHACRPRWGWRLVRPTCWQPPLQIVRMTAGIGSGRLVTPHLVRGSGIQFGTADGALSSENPNSGSVRPVLTVSPLDDIAPTTLAAVREGLRQTVADPQGTGYKTVRHLSVSIAGKSGTAEVGGGRPDHAWFTGYAPADAPQVAFVVLLEHAGSGGRVAGSLTRATVDALLRHGLLQP